MSTEAVTVFRHEICFNGEADFYTYERKEIPCYLDSNGAYYTVDRQQINKQYSFFFKSNLNKALEENGKYFVLSFDQDPAKAEKAVQAKLAKDIKKTASTLEVVKATHARLGNRLERIKKQ